MRPPIRPLDYFPDGRGKPRRLAAALFVLCVLMLVLVALGGLVWYHCRRMLGG